MLRVSENGHLLEALYYSTGGKKRVQQAAAWQARWTAVSRGVVARKKKRVGCFRIGFAGRSRDGG